MRDTLQVARFAHSSRRSERVLAAYPSNHVVDLIKTTLITSRHISVKNQVDQIPRGIPICERLQNINGIIARGQKHRGCQNVLRKITKSADLAFGRVLSSEISSSESSLIVGDDHRTGDAGEAERVCEPEKNVLCSVPVCFAPKCSWFNQKIINNQMSKPSSSF
jgi:hypothetical protein